MRREARRVRRPSGQSWELARQFPIGREDEVSEQALAPALDPPFAGGWQPPQLGLKAGAALVSPQHGVGDAEWIVRADRARVCYKRG